MEKIPLSWGEIALVVATALVSLSEAGRPSPCQIWKSDIQRSEETLTVSRNYKGLWLSEKCEIISGPQFLLRRYHILRNGKFHLTRFYYSDPWCTSPKFSVTVIGNFHPSPEKATSSSISWVVPGGLELDYTLRRMTLVPFTTQDAMLLASKINNSCPSAIASEWKPYKKYKVLNYEQYAIRNNVHRRKFNAVDDMDCTSSLDISFNELQLMRVEHKIPLRFMVYRPAAVTSADDPGRQQSYLYLGAEGGKKRNRPTYYQVPLLSAQTQTCNVCRVLSKASSVSPPELSNSGSLVSSSVDFDGHWISLQCEVRQYGLFLRREFFFSHENRRWVGQHEYFKDPQCKSPMFALRAEGTFSVGQPSKEIPDALECDFQIVDSSITPRDQQFASNLNGLPTCGSGSKWRVGQSANLSSSGGCKELGIVVPSTEFELIRFDSKKPGLTLLYLGDGTEDHKRPTSFQQPMVQCSHEEDILDDHNLLFNDLRPMPLIAGSLSLHKIQNVILSAMAFINLYVHITQISL